MAPIILVVALLLSSIPSILAANDPGHDSLYVLKIGDSYVEGSINLTNSLNATLVKFTNKAFGSYLDIVANGTLLSTTTTPRIMGVSNNELYIDSGGYLYLNALGGTSSVVQVGSTSIGGGDDITLNVSGTIRQQGVLVCLANGTNCLSGNNSGNISYIQQGNGLTVTNPGGPTTTIAINAVTCGAGQYSYWDSDSWECRNDNDGSSLLDGTGGWTNTSLTTTTALNVNVTTGNLTVVNGNIGFGTAATYARLSLGNTATIVNSAGSKIAVYDDGSIYGIGLSQYTNWGLGLFVHDTLTGTPKVLIEQTGRMGIGTTSPKMQLSVSGGSGGNPATSGTTPTGTVRIENGATQNVLDIGNQNGDPWGSWIQSTDKENLGLNWPLLLNPNGGNVGIGTISPNQKLDVNGSANFSGTNAQVWVNGSVVCTATNGLCSGSSSSGGGWTNTSLTTSTALNVNMTTGNLTIVNGNIGIGTLVPQSLLDTAANTAPGTPDLLQSYSWSGSANNWGMRLYQRHTGSSLAYDWTIRNGDTTDINTLTFLPSGLLGVNTTTPSSTVSINGNLAIGTYATSTTGPNNGLIVSGNTGLGVTTPGAVLDVGANTGASSSDLLQKYTWTAAPSNWGVRLYQRHTGTSLAYDWTIRNGDTTDISTMTFTSNGNVGIGTTTPSSPLVVQSNRSVVTMVIKNTNSSQTNSLLQVLDSGDASQFQVDYNGYVRAGQFFVAPNGFDVNDGAYRTRIGTGGITMQNTGAVKFTGSTADQTADSGIGRQSAGVLAITDGSTGLGVLNASNFLVNGTPVCTETNGLCAGSGSSAGGWTNTSTMTSTGLIVNISSATPILILTNTTGMDGDRNRSSSILFTGTTVGGASANVAQIVASQDVTTPGYLPTQSGGGLSFYTSDYGGVFNERLRVQNDGIRTNQNPIILSEGASGTGLYNGMLVLRGSTAPLYSFIDQNNDRMRIANIGNGGVSVVTTGGENIIADSTGEVWLVSNNSRNVGIGTRTPNQKLDVNGSINVSGGSRNIWIDNSRVCTETNGLCAGSGSSAGGWTNTSTMTSTSLNVNVTTGNLTVMNGYIGVGVSTPQETLHISTVRSRPIIETTGTDQVGIELRRTGGTASSWIIYSPSGTTDLSFFTNSDVARFKSNGALGIGGETTINSMLAVKGNVAIGSNTAYSQATPPTGGVVIEGNVGIGTTTPTQKLEVNGSINVTSGNISVQQNNGVCFNADCTARMYYNGTALIIEGQ